MLALIYRKKKSAFWRLFGFSLSTDFTDKSTCDVKLKFLQLILHPTGATVSLISITMQGTSLLMNANWFSWIVSSAHTHPIEEIYFDTPILFSPTLKTHPFCIRCGKKNKTKEPLNTVSSSVHSVCFTPTRSFWSFPESSKVSETHGIM